MVARGFAPRPPAGLPPGRAPPKSPPATRGTGSKWLSSEAVTFWEVLFHSTYVRDCSEPGPRGTGDSSRCRGREPAFGRRVPPRARWRMHASSHARRVPREASTGGPVVEGRWPGRASQSEAVGLPGATPKERKTGTQANAWTRMLTAALATVTKRRRGPDGPPGRRVTPQGLSVPAALLGHRGEAPTPTTTWMDLSAPCAVEGAVPGSGQRAPPFM